MKRMLTLMALLSLLIITGAVLGQSVAPPEKSFEIVSVIGSALPRSLLYEPNFERIAMIDAYGRLLWLDALTYRIQRVLYESGEYRDYAFSRDGRWFALAIANNMELYDTQTGEIVSRLDAPGAALRVGGPLTFSPDDNLLMFVGTHPAPQSIRRFENDTSDTPWIWNLTAARNEGASTFPRALEAWQFFDYRNGFVLGPNNRIVAALPGRLHVINAYSLDVVFEIDTLRYEPDPLFVWFSLLDEKVYVRTLDGKLLQVDTERGLLIDIPLYYTGDGANPYFPQQNPADIPGLEVSQLSRVIGESSTRASNTLLTVLLGENYRQRWRYRPLTTTLIDVIFDPSGGEGRLETLLYVYDEQFQRGEFILGNAYRLQQMILSPDNEQFIIRRDTGNGERIEFYNMTRGNWMAGFTPATRDLGYYSYFRKNRILAYDPSGQVIISDFQRLDASTFDVIAEDLRYSTRFDQFFFTDDNQGVVTLAGDEWRLWDITTSEVQRREVLPLRGYILATSRDGYRFLTQIQVGDNTGVEILDVDTGSRRSVMFEALRGRAIEDVVPSPDWQHFFVIYSINSYGPYAPGNEIAIYSLDKGKLWFMAGDDLPPPNTRIYGWVNDQTAYIGGEGGERAIPARVFGMNFAADGTPQCLLDRYPDRASEIQDAWYYATLPLREDEIVLLAERVCAELDSAGATVPNLSADLLYPTATPVVISGVPACLTQKYANQAIDYAAEWERMTAGLSPEQINDMETLICEGIGTPTPDYYGSRDLEGAYRQQTMMIDLSSGIRYDGSYALPANPRPIQPIRDEFYRTTERQLQTVILSPDEQLIAASSLPGELVVYRFVTPYRTLLSWGTATAAAQYQAENRIAVLPTTTPTYSPIGTAQPTLTPTVTPTPPPLPTQLPDQSRYAESEELCPASTLYTLGNPPAGYTPVGRILAPVEGDFLWGIEPDTGSRYPDENYAACGVGLNCTFSPDQQWALVDAVNEVFLVRPDNTDQRLLFDKSEPPFYSNVPFLSWSGGNTLEYETYGPLPDEPNRYGNLYVRDILGVFPDPQPWSSERIQIRGKPAALLSRQPGGPYAVFQTTFSTGVNTGYEYYLYNTETREASYFARLADYPEQSLSFYWHPLGDRLFYHYPAPVGEPFWYQVDVSSGQHFRLGRFNAGVWSLDGRYTAYSTGRKTQQIAVWDTETGLTRTYCIPELTDREYGGLFKWSPDSRNIALQARLPKDEQVEGVGQHTLILDIESGAVLDLTTGVGDIVIWARLPGSYGN